MPQMSPLMWEALSLSMFVAMMVILAKFYFFMKYSKEMMPPSSCEETTQGLTWKW